MTTTELNIETLLPWGPGKKLNTANGPKILRKAAPTQEFRATWNAHKDALKLAGVGWQPPRGQEDWMVCWWQPVPGEEGERHAAIQKRKEHALLDSRATDSAIDLPCPYGLSYLGYQKSGILFCREAFQVGFRGVIIGDEMGLGKTIQAIGYANVEPSISKVIVVCPNTLKRNWEREFRKWSIRPLKVAVQKADCSWVGDRADVVIINYDILGKFAGAIDAQHWDLRIVDEAHYCKNPKAIRTKATFAIKADHRILLTGTPILNRPVELYPLLNECDPDGWSNFFAYARHYCAAFQMTVPVWKKVDLGGGRFEKRRVISQVWDFSGSSNQGELQTKVRSTIMVRRLKADVLTDLPPKQRQVIELPSDHCEDIVEEQNRSWESKRAVIEELEARVQMAKASDSREEYESAVERLLEGQTALFEEIAKLRHEIALAKVPQVIAYLEDALEEGKVVLFCHHLDVASAFKAHFPKAAVVTGQTPADQRQGECDRFQKNPLCTLFIGNDAAREGLTLTASSHVVFAESDWVPGALSQKEDRTHRIGQKDCVLVTHLVLEGSLDAHMLRTVIDKQAVIDKCLDRDAAPLMAEPPMLANGKTTITLSFDQVAEQAPRFNPELVKLAHAGIKRLAQVCDGAVQRDEHGFNGVDTRIGHSFARQLFLSQKQAVIAIRLCWKYKGQLGEEFVEPFRALIPELAKKS